MIYNTELIKLFLITEQVHCDKHNDIFITFVEDSNFDKNGLFVIIKINNKSYDIYINKNDLINFERKYKLKQLL